MTSPKPSDHQSKGHPMRILFAALTLLTLASCGGVPFVPII